MIEKRVRTLCRHLGITAQPAFATMSGAGGGAGASTTAPTAAKLAPAEAAGLETLNSKSATELVEAFFGACASRGFARSLASAAPYASLEELLEKADAAWFGLRKAAGADADADAGKDAGVAAGLSEWAAGFAAHGRLGEKLAEQKDAMQAADAAVVTELQQLTAQYITKHGFQPIIFAAGRSAAQLLAILKGRMENSTEEEARVCAEQTQLITRLRLEVMVLGKPVARGDGRSPITTHILDTSSGVPAAGVALELEIQGADGKFRPLSSGKTNSDGRVADLLPPAYALRKGTYRVVFHVQSYFDAQGKDCFYPFVSVVFKLNAPEQHYHVPLLLNPFGYSTYRGS